MKALLHALSKLHEVPSVCTPTATHWRQWLAINFGRRRVGVTRNRMICLVLQTNARPHRIIFILCCELKVTQNINTLFHSCHICSIKAICFRFYFLVHIYQIIQLYQTGFEQTNWIRLHIRSEIQTAWIVLQINQYSEERRIIHRGN